MNNLKITFSKIKKEAIFEEDFINLTDKNGTIEFKERRNIGGGIAVIYAPNGTGKTSLTDVLSSEISSDKMYFKAKDEHGTIINPEAKAFHIIRDQIDRNVIRGKTTDYLIGAQIKREYELRDKLNETFQTTYKQLANTYKKDFNVSKVTDALLEHLKRITNEGEVYRFIRSIVNTHKHGDDIEWKDIIDYIRKNENRPCVEELEKDKIKYVVDDMAKTKRIDAILEIQPGEIKTEPRIVLMEQQKDAIDILSKYSSLDSCIVCDREMTNGEELLKSKIEQNKRIYDSLDTKTKDILDKILNDELLELLDPFHIRSIIGDFISGNNMVGVFELQKTLIGYIENICNKMITKVFDSFSGTGVFELYDEYIGLVETQPVLDSEELMYIESIISENIGKKIKITRSENSDRNYILKIGNQDLLGTDRKDFELSTGEQNFVSLSFEFLLAKHSDKKYVVIDDPISSFDSIYKNKIAYCIISFLADKRQIILTHNTDLIRLLKVQASNCFNLYILNNTGNGENGFIRVSNKERNLLINLHKLVELFQNENEELLQSIKNKRQYLMAMIPFIRGYAHISLDKEHYYNKLSGIMHGYRNDEMDIASVYNYFFGDVFDVPEFISVKDIIELDCDELDILDKECFPLLSDTLEQTLIYYHIRMFVEKELVEIFNLTVNDNMMLGQIINVAFRCDDEDEKYEKMREYKVFFASRKTLLNEFNHFEGNINIFQPAIDIKKEELRKEIKDIQDKLIELRDYIIRM